MSSVTLKATLVLLSGAAVICGLVAAYSWYKASEVKMDYGIVKINDLPDIQTEESAFNFGFALEVNRTLVTSGIRNRRAAIWTAISIALSCASSVLSAFI